MVQDASSQMSRGSQGTASRAQTTQDQSTPFPWQEDTELTDDLERVAGTLGMSEDEIEQMRVDGVDESSWRLLAPALAAEEHLAQKYGIGFTAIDCYYNLTDDQQGNRAFMVRVTPQAGENAGNEYLVRCDWTQDAASPVWTEDYLAAARAGEYAAYVERLLEPGLTDIGPGLVITAQFYEGDMFGDDEGPATPIAELARAHMGELYVYVRRTEGMDEAAFDTEVATIAEAARATGLRLYITAGCIDRLGADEELTLEVGAGAMRNRDATDAEHLLPVCVWRRSVAVNEASRTSAEGAQAAS